MAARGPGIERESSPARSQTQARITGGGFVATTCWSPSSAISSSVLEWSSPGHRPESEAPSSFLIAESAMFSCGLARQVHENVALLVILAPSLDGGSLAPAEYGRPLLPFAP